MPFNYDVFQLILKFMSYEDLKKIDNAWCDSRALVKQQIHRLEVLRNWTLVKVLLTKVRKSPRSCDFCLVHHEHAVIVQVLAKSVHNTTSTYREMIHHSLEKVGFVRTFHEGTRWRERPLTELRWRIGTLLKSGYQIDENCTFSRFPNFHGLRIL